MKALLGRKVGMTQIFNPDGTSTPVTLLEAGPCQVTFLRTPERDGYSAVQIGFGHSKKPTKSEAGHLKASKAQHRYLREFRAETELSVGDRLDASQFEVGDKVAVTATSKGKGFAGTIKRHNFHRGPMTHGSRNKRRPGSIGSMYPQKIFKGKKMAGRMGNERVTTKNLKVCSVDADSNLLAINGAIPGRKGTLVMIKGSES